MPVFAIMFVFAGCFICFVTGRIAADATEGCRYVGAVVIAMLRESRDGVGEGRVAWRSQS